MTALSALAVLAVCALAILALCLAYAFGQDEEE